VRTILNVVVVAVLALSAGGCGYSLAGKGSFLPASVKVIGIPEFVNQTPFFEIERKFTDKVRTEFIGRGRYQVLPQADGVDAVLRGTITSISIAPANFNQSQQATRYVIIIRMKIEFYDLKADKMLWENPLMFFREEYDLPADTQAGNPAAFFGQSSNALERVAYDFARSVVSAILEAF
jgi:hypothetical protein